uniref:Uncharacterized protein n=1 Tax=Cacopsylla melanoneura TaxID=428564 RepID=A0A8D8TJI4_9HEMI
MKYSLVIVVILSSIFSLSALYMDVDYVERNILHRKPRAAKDKAKENDELLHTTRINPIEENYEEINPTSNTTYEGHPKMTIEEAKDEMEEKKDKENDVPHDDNVTSNEEQKEGNNQLLNTTNANSNDDIPNNDDPNVLPKTNENENAELDSKSFQANNTKRTPNEEARELLNSEENKELNEAMPKANGTNNQIITSIENIKIVPKTKENETDTSSEYLNTTMADAKIEQLVAGTCPVGMIKTIVWNVFDYIRSGLEHFFDILSTT